MNNIYSNSRPPVIAKDLLMGNLSQQTLMTKSIHSYFELARMIVAKVGELKIEKEKVILIADDEPLTFKLIEEFFKNANLSYEILHASSGRVAYDIALSRKPDLIITDWLMPEIDGLDLIKKLKANPETRFIPIIMTTGAMIRGGEFNKVLEAGAIDCVRKPFEATEIVARVKTALALQEAIKEINESNGLMPAKNQFLNFLMDLAPNPIFTANKLGIVLSCNEGFESLTGKLKTEIIGHAISELLPQKKSDSLKENWLASIEPGLVSRFDFEFINSFKEIRNLVFTCVEIGDGLEEIVIISITDITEIIQSGKTAMADLEVNVERLQTELDFKHQKLATQTELLIYSKNIKSNFVDAVSKLQPYLTNEGKAKFSSLLKQLHWEFNDEMGLRVEKDFDDLHARLYLQLEKICPTITKNEKRLCAYLKMNNGASDIAKIANKSLNSVNVAFARLRAKLQLPNSKDLRNFLLEITSVPNDSLNAPVGILNDDV